MCSVWEERLPMSDRLTLKMRDALESIHRTRAAWVSTETGISDVEAFVHWRTAETLERRGFIRIDYNDITIAEDTE